MRGYQTIRPRWPKVSFLVERRPLVVISLLAVALVLISLTGLFVGSLDLTLSEKLNALFGNGSKAALFVIRQVRLPRVLASLLVGAALALAGAIMQGVVRNPLASPDLMGINSGAALAAVIYFAVFAEQVPIGWLPVFAAVGGGAIALLIYLTAWKQGVSPIRMVLIGIGLSALLDGVRTIFILWGPLWRSSQAQVWLTGGLFGANWRDVAILGPWLLALTPLLFLLVRYLNVQVLGEGLATGLGSRVQLQQGLLLATATLLAAIAVAFGGGISFIALMSPHIARQLVGGSHGSLLPASALIGAILLVLADLAGRTLFSPLDLPAGVFTAVIGAPFFLYLLLKSWGGKVR